jgi:glycosyltransferase involved in cell wall biosynthesis
MGVTLLITTFNRAPQLTFSLQRLTALTKPDEVIVVDDGGTDNTEEVCGAFANLLPIRYLYNDHPEWSICSLARNIGVREASHEWIVVSEPELFWISDVIPLFLGHTDEHPDEVISAGTIYFGKGGYVPSLDVDGLDIAGDYSPPMGVTEAIGWVAPFTALYHRDWLMGINGWDEEFPGPWGWDDIDLLTRLRITGINQFIALDVKALHQHHGPENRGDVNFANEAYFRAKQFDGNESKDHPRLIANRSHEWGQLRTR